MCDISLTTSIERLESVFSKLNDKFFNGELTEPVITISPDSTHGAYGWCTTWKAWKLKGEEKDGGYYEINICAEYLARDFYLIAETMLHEMCHLYNLQNGIKDCSRGGTYHNRKFKECAEQHGLCIIASQKYGYAHTELLPSTREWLSLQNDLDFVLYRHSPIKEKSGKKKSSTRKYICPCCGLSVRATKEVKIVCYECEEILVLEQTESED